MPLPEPAVLLLFSLHPNTVKQNMLGLGRKERPLKPLVRLPVQLFQQKKKDALFLQGARSGKVNAGISSSISLDDSFSIATYSLFDCATDSKNKALLLQQNSWIKPKSGPTKVSSHPSQVKILYILFPEKDINNRNQAI